MIRVLIALAGMVVLAALFVILRPAVMPAGPTQRTIDVVVTAEGLEPERIAVGEGDRVTLRLRARDAVTLHVHGYDIERELSAGASEDVEFTASLTGRFEIEDEATATPLGELVVEPTAP